MSEGNPRAIKAAWLRRALAMLAMVVVLATASALAVAGQPESLGRYIVVLRNSIDHPGIVGRDQLARVGGRLGFVYRYGPVGYSATLPDGAAEALAEDPRVRAVRVDHLDTAAAQTTPTGIKRVYASTNAALKIDEKANFVPDVDVAVIDTGIDYEHPDLKVVERTYCNGTEKSAECTDKTGTDEDGHGTHVAGTIAAIDNNVGVVGVAPGARLWAVKVLDPNAWESEITAGINWVTEHSDKIEVANMSLKCGSLPCERPTMSEAVGASVWAGVAYAIAAGNDGVDASGSAYATQPDSLTVSALADYDGLPNAKAESLWTPSCKEEPVKENEKKVGADDTLALFSNWGKDVEIAAPGACIYSTYKGKGYAYDSGTSMATPHVAGAMAILAAQSNPETQEDVEGIYWTILTRGNYEWTDNPEDKTFEPLLDLSDEETFK